MNTKHSALLSELKDYRLWLKLMLTSSKGPFGTITDLARALEVGRSYVSQVISGARQFSSSQVPLVARYFQLSSKETNLLLALVELDRATHPYAKKYWQSQVDSSLPARDMERKEVSNSQDQIWFSSHWIPSVVVQLCSQKGGVSSIRLSKLLNLSKKKSESILHRLCRMRILEKKSKSYRAIASVFDAVDSVESMLLFHQTWRLKAIDSIIRNQTEGSFSTTPMLLTKNDVEELRELIESFVSQAQKRAQGSTQAEELRCLSVDLFSPIL